MKNKKIFTNNQGVLKIIEPFNHLRGIENKNRSMGRAKNNDGQIFEIYPASCDIDNSGLTSNCYCWATAKEVKEID